MDDESVITNTLAAILEQHGYAATRAYSGEHAVQMARQSAPDFLVCDVVMGEMDGIETAQQVQAACPDCRVVLITGAPATAELLARAEANGERFDMLLKPFHPSLLIETLKKVEHKPN